MDQWIGRETRRPQQSRAGPRTREGRTFMNQLPFEVRTQIAAGLVDGLSIRAAERLLGVHRDSIMRFGITAGDACAKLHDALVRDVRPTLIQADELWTFCTKKQRRVRQDDPA